MQLDDLKQQANKIEQNLNSQREELRLKSSQFNMNVKEQWAELEKKHAKLIAKLTEAKGGASEIGDDIYGTIQKMNNELKEGYDKIKSSIQKH